MPPGLGLMWTSTHFMSENDPRRIDLKKGAIWNIRDAVSRGVQYFPPFQGFGDGQDSQVVAHDSRVLWYGL